MCKECWSWYCGSSRNDASCIFTRSSSYTQEHTNNVNKWWLSEKRFIELHLMLACQLNRQHGSSLPTSFCVTVSMMVPKAGMVDILTELKAAGEEDNSFTIHSNCITPAGLPSIRTARREIRVSQTLSASTSSDVSETHRGLRMHHCYLGTNQVFWPYFQIWQLCYWFKLCILTKLRLRGS